VIEAQTQSDDLRQPPAHRHPRIIQCLSLPRPSAHPMSHPSYCDIHLRVNHRISLLQAAEGDGGRSRPDLPSPELVAPVLALAWLANLHFSRPALLTTSSTAVTSSSSWNYSILFLLSSARLRPIAAPLSSLTSPTSAPAVVIGNTKSQMIFAI